MPRRNRRDLWDSGEERMRVVTDLISIAAIRNFRQVSQRTERRLNAIGCRSSRCRHTYRVRRSLALILCLSQAVSFFLQQHQASAQAITELSVSNGTIRPLSEGGSGLHFSYRINRCGDVSLYLKCGEVTHPLVSDQREFRDTRLKCFEIAPKRFSEFGRWAGMPALKCCFLAWHRDCMTMRSTAGTVALVLTVQAPHGCELLSPPARPTLGPENITKPQLIPVNLSRPTLFPTDTRKRVVRPLAVAFLIGGCALATYGAIGISRNRDDDEGSDLARGQVGAGLLTAVISSKYLHRWVSDKKRNEANQKTNDMLLADWERRKQAAIEENERLLSLWEREKAAARTKNESLLREWEGMKEKTRQKNELIKQSFKIEVTTGD